jgi:NAD(P)H-flavin reductase/hemoglobin-like flavoprotein
MTASRTPPVPATTDTSPAPIDADALRQSWDHVCRYGDQVPLSFYSSLFLAHPYIRAMFPVSMAAQRERLVDALGRIVSRIDDLEAVRPMIERLGREHRRFGVVRDHYPALGDALLATLEHFCGARWTGGLARDWRAAFALVADVMVEAADADADTPAWWEATVVGHERRTVDVAVLSIRPEGTLPYEPGQSVPVETPLRPRVWRRYSPASLPRADGTFDLHVKLVDGGPVSSALVLGTQVGDQLRLGAPAGTRLTLAGHGGDPVLIAGGTGLSPLRALLQQVAAEDGHRAAALFWGARRHCDLYDLPALRELVAGHDRLRLVPCASDDDRSATSEGVEAGTAVDVALRHGPWADHEIYVCGSPAMVDGTLTALENAGISLGRVHTDEQAHEETPP